MTEPTEATSQYSENRLSSIYLEVDRWLFQTRHVPTQKKAGLGKVRGNQQGTAL